jgi:hypothetical protein
MSCKNRTDSNGVSRSRNTFETKYILFSETAFNSNSINKNKHTTDNLEQALSATKPLPLAKGGVGEGMLMYKKQKRPRKILDRFCFCGS